MSICTLNEQDARDMLCAKGSATNFQQSYFVEAGAGAGKTYIIIQRIVAQLLSGACKPEELVAITFTVKSTQELQARLDAELLKRQQTATTPDEAAHIQAIRGKLGQMQISTIHGFCQTMLQAMPFEAGLGMDLNIVELDTPYSSAFYKHTLQENPQQFDPIRDLQLDPYKLTEFFSKLCDAGDATLSYDPPTSPAIYALPDSIAIRGRAIHEKMHALLTDTSSGVSIIGSEDEALFDNDLLEFLKDKTPSDDAIVSAMIKINAVADYPFKRYGKEHKYMLEQAKSKAPTVTAAYTNAHPLYHSIKKFDSLFNSVAYKRTLWQVQKLVHATTMDILVPLVNAYKIEKANEHRLDFNDLLSQVRTMLKTSPTARAYFRQQYRVIYVDEFQDTDPVQAEFLFFLTTEEADFNTDWRKCKPRDGSLFLVGDPKQAIYRFRGADIQIYTEVKTLFTNGVGDVVTLKDNYRSDKVICDFVDTVFDPQSANPTNDQLKLSKHQAGYTSMRAANGSTGRGQVLRYMPSGGKSEELKENDPLQVVSFIKSMVANKEPVGVKNAHAAQYSDFLILTFGKPAVQMYVDALAAEGIPCVSSGDQKLEQCYPVKMGLYHLDALAHPTSGLRLGLLLQKCYGVTLLTIHRFIYLSKGSLEATLRNKDTLQQVEQNLSNTPEDEKVAQLCTIGRQLDILFQAARTQPPMAVIERLFDGGFHLWQSTSRREKHEDYAIVQQFLNGIRQGATGDLAQYCAFAQDYSTHGIEYQLQLSKTSNCVRVMNLHKSKGLEGNVVILAYAGAPSGSIKAHISRVGQDTTLYTCVYQEKKILGIPLLWKDDGNGGKDGTGWEGAEKAFLSAEVSRLNYVAATRAETMLAVSGGLPYSTTNPSNLRSRWNSLYLNAPSTSTLTSYTSLTAAPATSSTTQATASANPLRMNTAKTEQYLASVSAKAGVISRYAISPSKLDHGAPRAQKTDDQTVATDSAVTPVAPPPPTPSQHHPFGPDWGTIVHRVLELWIRDRGDLECYARQAIAETLPSATLSATQSTMLLGQSNASLTPAAMDTLCQEITAALAFLQNGNAPLAQLLQQGIALPELSFFTAVEQGELYDHLHKHLSSKKAHGMALDVQGFIDLAISTPKGWIVVDYKTDRLNAGEPETHYRKRLQEEYTNQISAYGKLLSQATGQAVLGLYLCAIPLSGDLIPL